MADNPGNLPAINYFTPVEVAGIYRSYFERSKSNNIVWLRGIYIQRSQNGQWASAYDELRDVNSSVSITLKINRIDRDRMTPNSLVMVGGLIELNASQSCNIQLILNVTRFEVIKDQFVTEQDLMRSEIRITKSKKGFKNVDAILEEKLFRDERPKVALVIASTSITMQDFNAGVNAAAAKIDFKELRQSFGSATSLSSFLASLDAEGYDVIALVRGGGTGIEALDEIAVLQLVAAMKTPIICAIGHVGEDLFMKSIADKVAPTPNGLGQYFSEMVERVNEKRTNSRAALVKEVEGQFKKQIEESNKKNQELIKQVEKLTAQSKAQSKTFDENLKKLQDDNKKALEKVQADNKKTIDSIQEQNKKSLETANIQNENLSKQLQNLTKSQQDSLNKLTEQNKKVNDLLLKEKQTSADLAKKLAEKGNNSALIIIVAIASIIAGLVIASLL